MQLPKLTNARLVRMYKDRKRLYERKRALERKIERATNALDMAEHLHDRARRITEIYDGVALEEYHYLGTGWVRADHNDCGWGEEFRVGRYWDNAHNPGKGDWNMELQTRRMTGPGWDDHTVYFKFTFGTEAQCVRAIKQWVVHGELPADWRAERSPYMR